MRKKQIYTLLSIDNDSDVQYSDSAFEGNSFFKNTQRKTMSNYILFAKSKTLSSTCFGCFSDQDDAFDFAAELAKTLYDEAISFELHEVKDINYAMQKLQQNFN